MFNFADERNISIFRVKWCKIKELGGRPVSFERSVLLTEFEVIYHDRHKSWFDFVLICLSQKDDQVVLGINQESRRITLTKTLTRQVHTLA